LCVEGIEQEDVKEAAAIQLGQAGEEAKGGCVFALSRTEPFEGQEGFDGAADDLAAHGAMIVLKALDALAGCIFHGYPALQATLTVAAKAGSFFHP
jgi:hypothetical protein